MEQNASSFVRIMYEKHLFIGNQGEEVLLNEEEYQNFIRRHVLLLNPSAK